MDRREWLLPFPSARLKRTHNCHDRRGSEFAFLSRRPYLNYTDRRRLLMKIPRSRRSNLFQQIRNVIRFRKIANRSTDEERESLEKSAALVQES